MAGRYDLLHIIVRSVSREALSRARRSLRGVKVVRGAVRGGLVAASIPVAAGSIFISYRREESAYPAGWLFDRLAEHFGKGQVFKDVDSIEPGDDFVEVINAAVGACDVLLALIGNRWLTTTGEDGRQRLDDPEDLVRLEIEAALARKVRVIPVLVEGARMPRAAELPPSLATLARRQALELSPAHFNSDTDRLVKALNRSLVELQAQQAVAAHPVSNATPQAEGLAGIAKPSSALAPDEEQIINVRRDAIVLTGPTVVVLGTLIIATALTATVLQHNRSVLAIIWTGCGVLLGWLTWKVIAWSGERFIVSSRRVLVASEVRGRWAGAGSFAVDAMPFADVTDISYRKSLLGRIFNYGDLFFEPAAPDEAIRLVDHIPYPEKIFLELYELIFPSADYSSDN